MREPLALDGKWCSSCQTVKLLEGFYTCNGVPERICKTCKLARAKVRNAKPAVRKARRDYWRQYWRELKADPIALAAYYEKQNKRKHERGLQHRTL